MPNFFRLSGDSIHCGQLPERCPQCGCKDFYKQSDFKRSLGLTAVGIASASTCVLFAYGFNWWTVWSPMLVALIVDRVCNYLSPVAALCYDCGLILRDLPETELAKISGFDLDTYDRHQYPKRVEKTP
jgi:hypothetical protein